MSFKQRLSQWLGFTNSPHPTPAPIILDFVTPHRGYLLLFFYLVMPLLLGILLGDGLGIDLSNAAARHIGLLRFIRSAGIDIRTKSMIFILYLLFSPCILYYFKDNPPHPDPLKAASVGRLLMLTVGTLIMIFAFYALFFMGPHESYIVKLDRKIQSLLALSQWDISFAIFVGGMLFGGMACIYAPFLFINELLLRLKNRIGHIGRSK